MDAHLRNLCSSSSCRSCDENLDDGRPFDLMCCVHYDGLVADNCYYPDSANGETTNPSTDDSEDS